MENRYPYLQGDRFQTPNSQKDIASPYDHDSALFQDLEQRGIMPVYVETLNLSTAGGKFINVSGFHFVLYGHTNVAIKTIDTTAYASVWINQKTPQGNNPFPAKHARGFSGPFAFLYLEWPAQNNVYVDVVIFKGSQKPWIDGETPT